MKKRTVWCCGRLSLWVCEIRTRWLCWIFPLLSQTEQHFMLFCRGRNSITLRKPLQNPHWTISKVHGDDNLKRSRLLGAGNAQPVFAGIALSHFATRCINSEVLGPAPSSGCAGAGASGRPRPSPRDNPGLTPHVGPSGEAEPHRCAPQTCGCLTRFCRGA